MLKEAPQLRDQIVLASKGGIVMGTPYDSSAAYLESAVEASLSRMGVDRIDLYQIHRPDHLAHPAQVAQVLTRLRLAGKIGEVGLSNHTAAQVSALQAHLAFPIACVQIEFSPLVVGPLYDGTLDQALETDMGVMAWSPLAQGRLADGSSTDERVLAVRAELDKVAAAHGVLAHHRGLCLAAGPPVEADPHRRVAAARAHRAGHPGPRCAADPARMVRRPHRRPWSSPAVTQAPCEVSWFSALCDDDYEFLGVPDPALASSWGALPQHRPDGGKGRLFDNILLPSGYGLGIDTLAFAAGIAPMLKRMRLLAAIRCGEMWPPQLARQLATIDQMAERPADRQHHLQRHARRDPRQRPALPAHRRNHAHPAHPAERRGARFRRRVLQAEGGGRRASRTVSGKSPQFYFGGLSEDAREAAAKGCDVYLMWPDKQEAVKEILADMTARATRHGRKLKFGYRVHVVVRETESEARVAADRLLSHLDAPAGDAIRAKSLDSQSVGVRRQAELREGASDDGYAEANLWTGIGRARSGCGAAIVGDPDQVLAKLQAYQAMGIDAFILSGYPHAAEADLFARHVLPRLNHAPLLP